MLISLEKRGNFNSAFVGDNRTIYSVAIIGGGASGTALLYTLARYTNVPSLLLLEKYGGFGQVNSNAKNNSQTLHVGDIETNYSVDKAREVKPAAMMVKYYTDQLAPELRARIICPTQKMVLAVGETEVAVLEKRYHDLKNIFPELKKLGRDEIAALEPEVMAGRSPREPVTALFNPAGYAVDFGKLAESFVDEVKKIRDKTIDIVLNRAVRHISLNSEGLYVLKTDAGEMYARAVVVDADAHSLGFAKAMGYGKQFSLIPIAGSFYFSKQLLQGKVYTVQDPHLPFAAVHGDPDLNVQNKTRWGPTARFFPVLESRNFATMRDYFIASGLRRWSTWKSFFVILLEPVRFWYLAKNILYEIPYVGTYFFIHNIKKIVPTITARDISRAKGFGGMRLQRVDVTKNELQLGEGKIVGERIIFNMTPSPGASVCLYNGMRDTEQIIKFFVGQYHFDKKRLVAELTREGDPLPGGDVSQKQSYSS